MTAIYQRDPHCIIQPTSEWYYLRYRSIVVQDGALEDDHYTATCYFTSEGQWEVTEEIFTVIK